MQWIEKNSVRMRTLSGDCKRLLIVLVQCSRKLFLHMLMEVRRLQQDAGCRIPFRNPQDDIFGCGNTQFEMFRIERPEDGERFEPVCQRIDHGLVTAEDRGFQCAVPVERAAARDRACGFFAQCLEGVFFLCDIGDPVNPEPACTSSNLRDIAASFLPFLKLM